MHLIATPPEQLAARRRLELEDDHGAVDIPSVPLRLVSNRRIVDLYFLQGLTLEAISEAVGLAGTTVHRRITYFKEHLGECPTDRK